MSERCFAERDGFSCSVLVLYYCPGYEHCHFYKSMREHLDDVEKANRRLRSLPREQQESIADMYHRGHMPWREGEE